jgi:hypothetical protein
VVVAHAEDELGDGEHDQLGIGDLRPAARSYPFGQKVVEQHVDCRQKGVEVGAHGPPWSTLR